MAKTLNDHQDKVIRVIGHTDNVPVAKSLQSIFPSNWELSSARAVNVVKFLETKGKVDPTRMAATGRGEHQPIAPNDTKENQAKNRRIEIILLEKQILKELTK